MYCTKCGKQIDYDAIVCNECLEREKTEAAFDNVNGECATEEVKSEPEYREVPKYCYAVPEQNTADGTNPRMFGFGKALASTILGFIGWIFAYITLLVCSFAVTEDGVDVAGVILNFIATGLSVPSLILGIKSITRFKACVRDGAVKPIPTLVLGISGTSFSALSLFFVSISMLIISMV